MKTWLALWCTCEASKRAAIRPHHFNKSLKMGHISNICCQICQACFKLLNYAIHTQALYLHTICVMRHITGVGFQGCDRLLTKKTEMWAQSIKHCKRKKKSMLGKACLQTYTLVLKAQLCNLWVSMWVYLHVFMNLILKPLDTFCTEKKM